MPNSRVLCLLAPLLITQAGCPLVGDLPERFDVAISASDSRESPKGSGPSGFAGSSWRIIRKSDAGDSSTYADISPDPYGGALGGLLERPPAGALHERGRQALRIFQKNLENVLG